VFVWLAVSSEPVSVDNEHAPQLYIVKRDGSGGVQLLRQRDVTDYLSLAEADPDSVVLTERLPDCADVASITVLRRAARNPSETWLCPYTHDTVVPPGLQISTSSMARSKVGRSVALRLNGITLHGTHLIVTEHHLPYEITYCHLPHNQPEHNPL